jgi:sialate O-acetylesterase
MNKLKLFSLIIILSVTSLDGFAKFSLPAIFGDGMILQRQKPIAIWGTANAGQIISVLFNDKINKCKTDPNGEWRIKLPKMEAGGPYKMVVNAGNDTSVINNVLIGEVWLCSGQSNMNFNLGTDKNASIELTTESKNIRQYRCAMPPGVLNPENIENSRWVTAAGPDHKKLFSAVAYYFAKSLQEKLHIPIGIIIMSCGATRAEAWTDSKVLRSDTAAKPMLDYWAKNTVTDTPKYFMPGKFYDAVVKPAAPYTAKGLIWYQGESNTIPDNSGRSITERADEYIYLLKDLIKSFRINWQNNKLPVYIVQLPFLKWSTGDIQWAKIRQAQLDVAKEVNDVGLAVTVDVADSTNLHPINKQPVGERLARWALSKQYHFKDVVASGPIISNLKITGRKAIVHFKYAIGGLNTNNGGQPGRFEIADALFPGIFVPASATINKNTVIVTNISVKNPVAVRYAWSEAPGAFLFNGVGLPASPFLVSKSLKSN